MLSGSVSFKVGGRGWHSNEQVPPSVLSQPIGCWAPALKATFLSTLTSRREEMKGEKRQATFHTVSYTLNTKSLKDF